MLNGTAASPILGGTRDNACRGDSGNRLNSLGKDVSRKFALRAAPPARHRVAVAKWRFGAGWACTPSPSNLPPWRPRRARRRSASLRQETNAKRPPEGGLFYICIPGGERGIRTPDHLTTIPAFQASALDQLCDLSKVQNLAISV